MASTDTNSQFQSFMNIQNDIARNNMNLYPFTQVNPYDSWLTRMRISWLGETACEYSNRMRLRETAMSDVSNLLDHNIQDSPLLGGALTPLKGLNSGFSTPRLGSVGINPTYGSGTGLMESLEASASFQNTFDKISSLPATPTVNPTTLPEIDITDLQRVNPSWMEHVIKDDLPSAKAAGPSLREVPSWKQVAEDGFSYAKAVAKGSKGKGRWGGARRAGQT